jgi:anti-sigma factor RsiW
MNEFIHLSGNHLSDEQIVKALDSELSSVEQTPVDLHLASCEECLERYEAYSAVSETISRAMDAVPVAGARAARAQLTERINESSPRQRRHWRRFIWAGAAAACFALLLLVAGYRTQTRHQVIQQAASRPEASRASSFIRLPYSDPALPLESADIVRVQMRVSTLANAGIIRLPPNANDGWVQADVLLGMDGEPYGIRLVSAQSNQ